MQELIQKATIAQFKKHKFYELLVYLFNNSAKIIRGSLVVYSAGVLNKDVLKIAVAIELIHTASLIHDDILDDHKKRRGKKSLHVFYNPKIALLIGDFLFTRAITLANSLGNLKIIDILSRCVSLMVEGQIKDCFSQIKDQKEYFKMIEEKTASLFEAACESGALLSPLGGNKIEKLKSFGRLFGICYQILDDLNDKEYKVERGILKKSLVSNLKKLYTFLDCLDEQRKKCLGNFIKKIFPSV